MTSGRAASGQYWEEKASKFLVAQGLKLVARGYRCRLGELDIICSDGPALVICEVRARSSTAFVSASESVDRHKRRRIVGATRHFLMRHCEYANRPLRFDVIAVDEIDAPKPRLQWIKNAFQLG